MPARSRCTAAACSACRPTTGSVNTVFQDYALFPHMNVLDNVAYGLMVRGVAQAERYRRAEEMLELVALGGLGGRRPAALSGGQRQRVALARALINQPEVLLLDEPLGALDLKLRQQMQSELKALQRKVGITFVYVTHDQEEALGMSDRLAVFNLGRIEQIGTPEQIYERPATAFVAGFVGASNIVDADDRRAPDRARSGVLAAARADPAWARPEDWRRHGRPRRRRHRDQRPVPWRQHPDRGRSRRPARPRWSIGRTTCAARCGRSPAAGCGCHGRMPPCSRWTAASHERRHQRGRVRRRRRPRHHGSPPLDLPLSPRRSADACCCWLRRSPGSASSIWARCSRCWSRASSASTTSAARWCYEFTLRSYAELLTNRANLDIILRTVSMAAAVTLGAALIGFPIAYVMARYATGRAKALFYLAVMLPLWSSYLVRVYAWKLILAKEGVVSWAFAETNLGWLLNGVLALPVIGGPSLSVSYLGMFLVFTYIWLPFMILPTQAALERVPQGLIEASADLGARPFTTFRTVILPLAFPGIVAGSIFTFSLTLGDYIIPYIIGSSRFFIGQAVYVHQGTAGNIPLAAAFSVVPIVIMAVYLTIARRLGAFDAL